jgi:hypothetical protein
MAFFDESQNPDVSGVVDRFVRRFSGAAYAMAVVALYAMVMVALALALTPSVALLRWWGAPLWQASQWWSAPVLALALAAAFLLSGAMLLVVVPLLNAVLPTRVRPFKGGYFTGAAVPWLVHNGLLYLVRLTVLPFVTLTPLGTWFLRAMGMRIGKRVRIATENFSDARMIELADDAAIGGSATLFAHFGGGGHLVMAPVVIGRRATIGEKATVMGDVIVGDDAVILPHAVLIPGSRVPPGERWGGAPARPIPDLEWDAYTALVRDAS